jgi:glycosyltransferase involved in cell wall biosynthesis
VIHIHALFSPISSMSAWIARQIGVPYILRPLGTLDPADLQKKKILKQLYAAVLEGPNLKAAAAVHFTSAQEAATSMRFGATTTDWIYPLGVQLPEPKGNPRAKYNLDQPWPIVLFMSRIDPKKGLDLLIPALEQIAQELSPFYFVLAGGNPQDPTYEKQIRDRLTHSTLADRTRPLGFVSGSDKTALLAAADLFVLPSYYENFGIAVAEAMHVGTPVLISDQVHIHNDISQSQSGWVCECSIESLVQNLRLALSDEVDRSQRAQNAQTYAKTHYNWSIIAPQLIQAYQTLTKKPAPAQNITPIEYDDKSAMDYGS